MGNTESSAVFHDIYYKEKLYFDLPSLTSKVIYYFYIPILDIKLTYEENKIVNIKKSDVKKYSTKIVVSDRVVNKIKELHEQQNKLHISHDNILNFIVDIINKNLIEEQPKYSIINYIIDNDKYIYFIPSKKITFEIVNSHIKIEKNETFIDDKLSAYIIYFPDNLINKIYEYYLTEQSVIKLLNKTNNELNKIIQAKP